MTVDNVVCVEHPFGAHDMFANNPKEDEMGSITVTVRCFAEAEQTFHNITSVYVDAGFLYLHDDPAGAVYAFNVQDVAAYRTVLS